MRQKSTQRLATGLSLIGLVVVLLHQPAGPVQLLRSVHSLHRMQAASLLVALLLSVLSMLISGALWSRLLLCLGHTLSPRVGLAAFLSAGLASYLVNLAGSAAGSAVVLRHHGLGPQRAALLALLANTLGFCGMLVWAPLGLVSFGHTGVGVELPLLGQPGLAVVSVLLVALLAGMLAVLKALTSALTADNALVRRLVGTKGGPTGPSIRFRPLVLLVPWSAISWLAGALALYALLDALSPRASLNLGTVIGALALASTLGSLAFFVPAGVGVRDGALVTLLAHGTGLPVAECAAAAIGVRALDLGTKLGLLLVIGGSVALRLSRSGHRTPDKPPQPEERYALPGCVGRARSKAEVNRLVVHAPVTLVDAHLDLRAAATRREHTGGREEPEPHVIVDAA